MRINPKLTLSEWGGKAYQLYRLLQHFDVPPFFVVSFEEPLEITKSEAQKAIIKECEARNFDLMSVRSSAVCEDSPKTSFAGMFKTVLCVKRSKIIEAISEVLNSVLNERVAEYCETQGIDHKNIKMSVIIQKMISSRVSGVCFTRLQTESGILIIEACYGLGEALVSGRITPDTYKVDRNSLKVFEETIGYQSFALQVPKDDSVEPISVEIPFHKRNAKKLTEQEIIEIAETGLLVEEHLDFSAADIEWAYEADILFVLQARPYTGFIDHR